MAGNANSGRKANENVFRHAILEKLDALDPKSDRKRIYNIAGVLLKLAEGGDLQAIREVMDRVDGKPKQSTEVSGPDGGAIPISEVVYKIIDPTRQD